MFQGLDCFLTIGIGKGRPTAKRLQGDGSHSEWEWLADCLPSPRWMAQHVEALGDSEGNVLRSCC